MRCTKFELIEHNSLKACAGYTLFTPIANGHHTSYLLDMDGLVAHQWELPGFRGGCSRLLPNGNLLTSLRADLKITPSREEPRVIRELDWDGNTVWECNAPAQHHDFLRLTNGNTVYIGFERIRAENIPRIQGGIAGSEMSDGSILGDCIREVNVDGDVVWEWSAQDNMELKNYPIHPLQPRDEFCHANSIFPLSNGDYLISFRRNSMIFIIDRATKQVRWEKQDPTWGGQHDAQQLDNGNILLFANGLLQISPSKASRVIEFNPETEEEVWVYEADPPWAFYSPHISGAQRLSNGNTLICEGLWGRIFEITLEGEIVWEYISPHFGPCGPPDVNNPSAVGNWVFRAYRYASDSPEINGRLP